MFILLHFGIDITPASEDIEEKLIPFSTIEKCNRFWNHLFLNIWKNTPVTLLNMGLFEGWILKAFFFNPVIAPFTISLYLLCWPVFLYNLFLLIPCSQFYFIRIQQNIIIHLIMFLIMSYIFNLCTWFYFFIWSLMSSLSSCVAALGSSLKKLIASLCFIISWKLLNTTFDWFISNNLFWY